MKKLLGIIVLGLLLSGNANSEINELKSKSLNRYDHGVEKAIGDSGITTVCIEGYFFVTYSDYTAATGGDGGNTIAVSIVQLFEERDGKSLPKKC